MKKQKSIIRIISVLALLLLMASQVFSASYKDINGHWSEKTVTKWLNSNYISGYPDGTFKPNQQLTRAEFITLLNKIKKPQGKSTKVFNDLNTSAWYYDDMLKAVKAGYISGFEDDTLRPDAPITREQVVTVLSNVLQDKNGNLEAIKSFNDYKDMASYSKEAFAMAVSKGYLKGYPDNTIRPKKAITRAEAVVLLDKIFSTEMNFGDKNVNQDFKVISYYPYWGSVSPKDLNYEGMSIINYAFALPNDKGGVVIQKPSKLRELVEESHKNNVKVYLAVGGWGYDEIFRSIASNPQKLDVFVKGLSQIVKDYNLDGIDLDWEYPDTNNEPQDFTKMVKALGQSLRLQNKGLSAAVIAGVNQEGNEVYSAKGIRKDAIDALDFINIMVYDGQYGYQMVHHSSMNFAKEALDYWKNKRNVPEEKLILGVPFYGRNKDDQSRSYRQLIATNKAYTDKDFADGYYYNGLTTMESKTKLALQEASGIMIWEITQDSRDENSLYKRIIDTVKAYK